MRKYRCKNVEIKIKNVRKRFFTSMCGSTVLFQLVSRTSLADNLNGIGYRLLLLMT